jgi:hypothetical protein
MLLNTFPNRNNDKSINHLLIRKLFNFFEHHFLDEPSTKRRNSDNINILIFFLSGLLFFQKKAAL